LKRPLAAALLDIGLSRCFFKLASALPVSDLFSVVLDPPVRVASHLRPLSAVLGQPEARQNTLWAFRMMAKLFGTTEPRKAMPRPSERHRDAGRRVGSGPQLDF